MKSYLTAYLTYALWNKVALSINTQKPFSLPSLVMSLLLHCNTSHIHMHPEGKDISILILSAFSLPKGFRNHGNLTFPSMETITRLTVLLNYLVHRRKVYFEF